jgi:hypothetical protein
MPRPRLLPEKSFPTYVYLPGKHPHPVRDPGGHSYRNEPVTVAVEAALGSDVFRWGIDLFNHGYYWEAHEAWEPLWHAAKESWSLLRAMRQELQPFFVKLRGCRATSLRPRSECRLLCSQSMPKQPQLPRLFCRSRCVDSLSPFSISYSYRNQGVTDRQPSKALEISFHDIRLPACSRRQTRSWSRARFPSHHDVLLYVSSPCAPRVMIMVATSSSLYSPPAC